VEKTKKKKKKKEKNIFPSVHAQRVLIAIKSRKLTEFLSRKDNSQELELLHARTSPIAARRQPCLTSSAPSASFL